MTEMFEYSREACSPHVPERRRREILASKWRSLPSLYWSIVVGVLTVFSVAQASVLREWSVQATLGLLGVLLGAAFGVALLVAWKHQTPTEKLAQARALFSEGRRRFGEKDYQGAADAAARSVALDPDECSTWNLLGRAKVRLGDGSGAVAAFSRAGEVNVQPDWRTIYLHNRGVSYLLLRDYGRARNDFDACVKDSPRNWTRLRWRALANLYLGDCAAALDDARASVHVTKRVSNLAVLALVEAAANVGVVQDSQAARNARREKAETAEDYYYLGALEAASGDLVKASRLLRIAEDLDDKMAARACVDALWDTVRYETEFCGLLGLPREDQVNQNSN